MPAGTPFRLMNNSIVKRWGRCGGWAAMLVNVLGCVDRRGGAGEALWALAGSVWGSEKGWALGGQGGSSSPSFRPGPCPCISQRCGHRAEIQAIEGIRAVRQERKGHAGASVAAPEVESPMTHEMALRLAGVALMITGHDFARAANPKPVGEGSRRAGPGTWGVPGSVPRSSVPGVSGEKSHPPLRACLPLGDGDRVNPAVDR